jgi:hypothetical protein
MARISVWFVRAALLHFAIGATAGAWRLAAKSGRWLSLPFPVRPFHVEVVLIGWVCQLALGVALWILPFSRAVSEDGRFWTALMLLNGGIVLVITGQLSGVVLATMLGRSAEVGAGLLLIWGLWPRLLSLPQRSSH